MNIYNSIKILILIAIVSFSGYAQQKDDLIGYWKSCDEGDNMVVKVELDDKNNPKGYLVGFQKDDGTWEKNKPKKGIIVM